MKRVTNAIRKGGLTLSYHYVDSDALSARRAKTLLPPPPSSTADTEPDLRSELDALELSRREATIAIAETQSALRPTVPASKRGGL